MKKLWTQRAFALFAAGLAAGAAPTAAGAAEPELPDAVRESIETGSSSTTPAVVPAGRRGRARRASGASTTRSATASRTPTALATSAGSTRLPASYLEVRTTPVCATDPSHPSWVVGISTAAWYIDATLDGFDDFVIVVFHDGSHLVGGLYDLRYADPLFLCRRRPCP